MSLLTSTSTFTLERRCLSYHLHRLSTIIPSLYMVSRVVF